MGGRSCQIGVVLDSDGVDTLEDLDVVEMIGWLARDGGSGLRSWHVEPLQMMAIWTREAGSRN